MARQITDILREFLHIVNYPNNKEKFIKEFEETNHLEALANIGERVSLDMREKLQAMQGDTKALIAHIGVEEYRAEVTKVSHNAFRGFIEVVSPLVKLDQKQKIVQLLHK